MAAGGQVKAVVEPEDFDVDGLDIDAALAKPEAHVRRDPAFDQGRSLEGHVPTLLHGPIRPSAEDVDRHDAIHVPYRNLCPICVAARGKEDPHRRQVGELHGRRKATPPKFCVDYQELKSKPKIRAESQAATETADSVLRILLGKD